MWQRMSTANHPAEFYELPHEPLAQALQRFASAGGVGVGSGAAVSCWNEMVWAHCNSGKAEYVSVWKLLGPRASIPSVLDSHFQPDQQKHPLPLQDSKEKDSAWLLATLRNSLILERKRAISPSTR